MPTAVVERVSSVVRHATGGHWRVEAIERRDGVVSMRVMTPEGPQHVELTRAEPGAIAYRVVGRVALRYRPTDTSLGPGFFRALDGLAHRCGALLDKLVAGDEAKASGSAPQPAQGGASDPNEREVERATHAFALAASGFTRVPRLVPADLLEGLREAADRALDGTRTRRAQGAEVPANLFDRPFHEAALGLHLWGDACLRVIESDAIREISDDVIGPHKLLDVVLFVSHPAGDAPTAEGWHRDSEEHGADERTRFLWFMVPLDPFGPDNGSTWLVPGSHRHPTPTFATATVRAHLYPSRVQMTVDAGDAFVVDPATLHSRGHNVTDQPRRMMNVLICHRDVSVQWQWDRVGRRIREAATPRLRELLGADVPDAARTELADRPRRTKVEREHAIRSAAWPALPEDWVP